MNVNVAQAELKRPPKTGFKEMAIEAVVLFSFCLLMVNIFTS